jgi:hypothetical protein
MGSKGSKLKGASFSRLGRMVWLGYLGLAETSGAGIYPQIES